MTHRLSVLD